jgi:hypothetical protein
MKRRLRQSFVRVDLVQPLAAEIIDDGTSRMSDVIPRASSESLVLEAGHRGNDGFFAAGRAAREYNRVHLWCIVAQAQ